MRSSTVQMLARLLLAAATESPGDASLLVKEAETLAARLATEHIGYADVWAHLVRAGVAARRGQPERALAELRRTIAEAEEHQMMACASAARWRQAQLPGGSDGEVLKRRANEWLNEQCVVNPAQFIDILAPGFR